MADNYLALIRRIYGELLVCTHLPDLNRQVVMLDDTVDSDQMLSI